MHSFHAQSAGASQVNSVAVKLYGHDNQVCTVGDPMPGTTQFTDDNQMVECIPSSLQQVGELKLITVFEEVLVPDSTEPIVRPTQIILLILPAFCQHSAVSTWTHL